MLDTEFKVTFSGRDTESACQNLRMEELDPNFPQQAALRSPLIIKCDISFPDMLVNAVFPNYELHFTLPDVQNSNMASMVTDMPMDLEVGDMNQMLTGMDLDLDPEMFSDNDQFGMTNVESSRFRSDAVLSINAESSAFRTRAELLAEIRAPNASRKRRANGKLT